MAADSGGCGFGTIDIYIGSHDDSTDLIVVFIFIRMCIH